MMVLNLVISGIPSILKYTLESLLTDDGFKPCYKWNTFNTLMVKINYLFISLQVLNLVISGIPSILIVWYRIYIASLCFKPCYKWNTFNTPNELLGESFKPYCFKPCYKWNTFNTIRIEEGLGRLSKF